MSITATYTASGAILAIVDGVEMTIPADMSNRHYAELIASGVEIAPLPTPTAAEALAAWRERAEISQAQARLTLHQLGLLSTVQAIADADPAASIVWEYADVIKRNSPFIDGLGAAAFTPEQIDDIFVYAMGLVL